MSTIRTNLSATREAARQIRFEQAASISKSNVQSAIEQLAASTIGVAATAVTFAMSPYTPTINDILLEVDTSAGIVVINMPLASARLGRRLSVKDSTGNASTNNIQINRAGAETIDGLTQFLIRMDYGGIELYPRTASYGVSP